MGVIRSSVSCSSTPSQTLVLHAFEDKNNDAEKLAFRNILEKRYRLVRNFVDTHKSDAIEAMPFNSGYFMSFKMNGINAEQLRKKLLAEKGIGTISIDDNTLRVAFSSIEENLIEKIEREELHSAIAKLSAKEKELIQALFFDGYTERQWSALTGIPQKTINDRKHKILEKIKKFLKN